MKTLKTVVIALALIFIVVVAAEATDLYTPPMYVNGSDCLNCTIVNVGTADKTIRIRIINDLGYLIADSGEITLEPGKEYMYGMNFNGSGYCRFTVSGSKTGVRAAAKIWPSSGSDTIAIRAE